VPLAGSCEVKHGYCGSMEPANQGLRGAAWCASGGDDPEVLFTDCLTVGSGAARRRTVHGAGGSRPGSRLASQAGSSISTTASRVPGIDLVVRLA
jgi:hypothetical protein